MMRPIEIMSISAVAMMKGIAAARSRREEKSLKRDCVTGVRGWGGKRNPDSKRSCPADADTHYNSATEGAGTAMSYDEKAAERVRKALFGRCGVSEKKM